MGTIAQRTPTTVAPKRLNVFERYLTLWVGLCMLAGLALGKWAPSAVQALRSMEFGKGSQVNVPIAVLIWLMIIPMMMKVDFSAILNVRQRPRGLLVTLFVNWLVKPFSMALIGWVFFRHVFSAWISPAEADQYIAGVIILAAAPCTAMVFVWSYLTDGDPAYTLVQVSVNDLIMLFLFAPDRALSCQRCFVLDGSVHGAVVFRHRVYRDSARGWNDAPYLAHSHPRQELVRAGISSEVQPGDGAGSAGDISVHLRVPSREHYRQVPSRGANRNPDSDSGLL